MLYSIWRQVCPGYVSIWNEVCQKLRQLKANYQKISESANYVKLRSFPEWLLKKLKGFFKKLLWYKWTSHQVNIFCSLFDHFCCAYSKTSLKLRKKMFNWAEGHILQSATMVLCLSNPGSLPARDTCQPKIPVSTRSQSTQDPSQPKIPVGPRSQSTLDIVLNNLIIIIRTFESELLMKINQYVYQNYCSMW